MVKTELSTKAKHREIVAEKEPEVAYNAHFDSKKCTLSPENTVILDKSIEISACCVGSTLDYLVVKSSIKKMACYNYIFKINL